MSLETALTKLKDKIKKQNESSGGFYNEKLLEKVVSNILKDIKGDPGQKGDKGDKPEKGIDYFTNEDIESIKEISKPKKGIDYFDGGKGEKGNKGDSIVGQRGPRGPEGKSEKINEDGFFKKTLKQIKLIMTEREKELFKKMKAEMVKIAMSMDRIGGGSGFATVEVPTGAVNGSNKTFVLSSTPKKNSLQLYWNGQYQREGASFEYTLSGSIITFNTTPFGGAVFAVYQ